MQNDCELTEAQETGHTSNYRLLYVNVTERALKQLQNIRMRLQVNTYTNALHSSLEIANIITSSLDKKGKILIEEDGSIHQLIVPRG